MDYHPVHDIRGEESRELEGKCILAGITGSVAIYRSIDVIRSLIKRGAEVHVMMTREASKMVNPLLLEWATGNKVTVDLTGETEHIYMARKCDAMIIAPSTLNTMSKIAHSIADENVPLTALSFLGYGKNVLVIPAMHSNMYNSKLFAEVLGKLKNINGLHIMEPKRVDSRIKLHETNDIVRWITPIILRGKDLEGLRILVTAGATREYIDRVRFISNPGTGRMGVEIAAEAAARGAKVTLLAGHLEVSIPGFIEDVVRVETTEEMAEKMNELTSNNKYDIILSAASPVDFRPIEFFDRKLKSGQQINVTLAPTPKVINNIAQKPRVLVAFVADVVSSSEELKEMAFSKLEKHGAEIAVANNVGRSDIGFASKFNEVVLVFKDGRVLSSGKMRKEEIARFILDNVVGVVKSG
ncbi:MAG: bifunctional phosphopantothenoylcysteine decarboxylase/phosphopantothenate--cysteine ligase CoaBC [Desulfurococcales archaeon]|nr:bifunctional phosphopantothenoylcysteine decarboxylase/phosphopantothenate--cysteine ligase CoaBC [Desulfurococcales archaeon]